jgi:hypothetical protein
MLKPCLFHEDRDITLPRNEVFAMHTLGFHNEDRSRTFELLKDVRM